ncbi:uncharacterized protein EAE97_005410 [Botrytis byssoidea]|uniref:Uncharacterized protein n=1 Tax=Botrytis byssoidea TaxID=139641 RepID=A0A9P5M713_9HELO|nr:uncharacterized protein EAE97_005410 [Botrytis byssoidea]KAF7944777.1 hypothetical protein EAE97_005410 [Botrytis byssoidea]
MEVNNQNAEISATEASRREERGQADVLLQRFLGELKIGKEAQKVTAEDDKNQAKKKTLAMIISEAQIKQRAARNKREEENAETTERYKIPSLSNKPTLNISVSPAPPKKNYGSELFQVATPSPGSSSNRSILKKSETTELNTDAVPTKLRQQHRHNNLRLIIRDGDDYVRPVREDCENPYVVIEQVDSIYAIEDGDTEEYVQKTAEIEGKIREMNVGTESEATALKKGIKDLERVMTNTARLIGEKRARLLEIKSERKKAEASLGKK